MITPSRKQATVSKRKFCNTSSSSSSSSKEKKLKETKKKEEEEERIISKWSEGQKKAIDVVRQGRPVVITGGAGTGKSKAVRDLIDLLRSTLRFTDQKNYPDTFDAEVKPWYKQVVVEEDLAITATTGHAAWNLYPGGKASTLHSWLGVGLGQEDAKTLIRKLRKKHHIVKRLQSVKVLIIDEMSMLSNLFDKLDSILREIRNRRDVPFGNVQVILVGDFMQLTPIGDNDPTTGKKKMNDWKFCFETKQFDFTKVFRIVELTHTFRQDANSRFERLLNRLRMGNQTKDDMAWIKETCAVSEKEKQELLKRDSQSHNANIMTFLFSRRDTVDACNQKALASLMRKYKRDATLAEIKKEEDFAMIRIDGGNEVISYPTSPANVDCEGYYIVPGTEAKARQKGEILNTEIPYSVFRSVVTSNIVPPPNDNNNNKPDWKLIGGRSVSEKRNVFEDKMVLQNWITNSRKNSRIPETLLITDGSFVELAINLDAKSGLTTGRTGTVIGFSTPKSRPFYRTTEGKEIVRRFPVVYFHGEPQVSARTEVIWPFREVCEWKGKELGYRMQIPLRPAKARTIHSSQGLTFRNLFVDAGNLFAENMAYVFMSRCRNLSDLKIAGFDWSQNFKNPNERAVKFYQNLKTTNVGKQTKASKDSEEIEEGK